MDDVEELKSLGIDMSQSQVNSIMYYTAMTNIVVGVILIIVGGFLIIYKKQEAKKRKTVGWVLISIGILMIIAHVMIFVLN